METYKLGSGFDKNDYYQLAETPILDFENFIQKNKVDTIILLLPKPLAGKGTARQLEQAALGLDKMAKKVNVLYIGPAIKNSSPLLSHPFEEIKPGESNPEVFSNVYKALENALNHLFSRGKRYLGFACFGYVMFGTEALRRILNKMNKIKKYKQKLNAIAVTIDSAYPDTEKINCQLDDQGRPLSRFYSPGYISSEYLDTFFLIVSSYPFNIDILQSRKPRGMSGISIITPPYTNEYIKFLKNKGKITKKEGINNLKGKIYGFQNICEDDIIIPLLSSDIWDSNSIGVWMTKEEYKTCIKGTTNIIKALEKVAQILNKRVFLPIDKSALHLIKSLELGNTFFDANNSKLAALHICPYIDLSQEDHAIMIASSDIVIGRTGGQANATAVAILAKKPYLVIDMPYYNYMQSYLTSLSMVRDFKYNSNNQFISRKKIIPYCWRGFWFWDRNKIANTIIEMLTDYEEANKRAENTFRVFTEMYGSPDKNFFMVFSKLIGYKYDYPVNSENLSF